MHLFFRNNILLNLSLTAFGVFSVVLAAVLCAGCGGAKKGDFSV